MDTSSFLVNGFKSRPALMLVSGQLNRQGSLSCKCLLWFFRNSSKKWMAFTSIAGCLANERSSPSVYQVLYATEFFCKFYPKIKYQICEWIFYEIQTRVKCTSLARKCQIYVNAFFATLIFWRSEGNECMGKEPDIWHIIGFMLCQVKQ